MASASKMNLSFAGCGFLGIYHIGVAVCFKKFVPHVLLNKISGASAGAIAACALLCELPIGEITTDVLRVVQEARKKTLGPFNPSFNVQNLLLEGLDKVLPEDAHLRVNGKLHISLTRVYDRKNVIVSQFNSKEDLMQALLASSFVPVFSGLLPPRFHGIRYMDGGFSDNLPTLDEDTVTVSPFCGESDICPRDTSSQLFHINLANTSIELSRQNVYRFTRILFPPKPETLAKMCHQGFDDAMAFLARRNMINCNRCLTIHASYEIKDPLNFSTESESNCEECIAHQRAAKIAKLPEAVVSIFQDAIASTNNGFTNWIFQYKGMKLLSILSLPYVLPVDIMYATFTKFVAAAPHIGNNLWNISKFMIQQVSELFENISKTQKLAASINCQLAITNFGGSKYDIDTGVDAPLKSKMNLNFTLNMASRERKNIVRAIEQRRCSSAMSEMPLDDDTFEQILRVTSEHETVIGFYYQDKNNRVTMTEIYDVTDVDLPGALSPEEQENNTYLQFDEDFDDPTSSTWPSQLTLNGPYSPYNNSMASISDLSLDDADHIAAESANVFSDPESEWNGMHSNGSFYADTSPDNGEQSLPESEQQTPETERLLTRKPSYLVLTD
ncbi:patatin-like phospholipase domain-containing protein 2 [Schistocerca americana]|uniref:patatin-like phospholipase domain-containing protein 2 n=1 Tax=Schistocerca americana TaxID=7009 RepID=UPI001F4F563E|nr:patatin-like phospholipase domain-containing protein 2 [Schistocerca americana]XP_049937611.1 patatin-like phospholipase domain-containing protein 2 [Schistocerca serialis cubense]